MATNLHTKTAPEAPPASFEDALAQTAPEAPLASYENALARAREGRGIRRDTALFLSNAAPLDALLAAAAEVRDRGKGSIVSFSRKVFIPLTTLCRDYCSYCTFRKDPGQPGAHFMTPDEVLALAEQGRRAGCKEALFSLGDQPERIFPEAREFLSRQGFARTLDYVAAMSELVLESRCSRTPQRFERQRWLDARKR